MGDLTKTIEVPINSGAQDCIEAGMQIAMPRSNPHPESRAYALVPKNSSLIYLDREYNPTRRRGTVKLHDARSFLEYWKRQADTKSYIYAAMAPAQFVAVLNEHHQASAEWRDHRAIFSLQHSKEWAEWTKRSGQLFDGNEAFAIWLEENLLDIIKPEPAKMMDIALNFRVNQAAAFGNAVRLQDGNVDLTYTNEVHANAGSSKGGKIQIPETFWIEVPVWSGLDAKQYKVEARFRYRLSGGRLSIRFELVRPHKVIEASFKDMLADIEKATKIQVLFGTPE